MLEAIPEAITHHRAFAEFNEHLRSDRLDQVQKWEIEYQAWVKKPTGSPCIFDTSDPGKFTSRGVFLDTDAMLGITMAQVKLQLANEEASKNGFNLTEPHTQSTFIILGLEIEGLQ